MQPVSMLMSNLNVEAQTHQAPNALAAAQDTGQSQEIIRDGIRIVQTVQASEAAANTQRVHRKSDNDEREGGRDNSRDSFERSKDKKDEIPEVVSNNAPLIRENVKSKKSFEFYA